MFHFWAAGDSDVGERDELLVLVVDPLRAASAGDNSEPAVDGDPSVLAEPL